MHAIELAKAIESAFAKAQALLAITEAPYHGTSHASYRNNEVRRVSIGQNTAPKSKTPNHGKTVFKTGFAAKQPSAKLRSLIG